MNTQYPPLPAAIKKDPRGSLFSLLLEEFKEEIKIHQERVGLNEKEADQLERWTEEYLDGLRRYRTDIDKSTEHFRKQWEAFCQPNASEVYGHWKVCDFLVTTPMKLEDRVMEWCNKIARALDNIKYSAEFELAYRRRPEEPCLPAGLKASPSHQRKLRQAAKWSDECLKMISPAMWSIEYSPKILIATTYESFLLKDAQSKGALYNQEYLQTYIQSYSSLDSAITQGNDKHFRRRQESYVQELKKHAGDLKAMAEIINERLDEDIDCAGGSRSVYIDPFYPRDFAKIQFPSAQADFVAARLIACQMRIDGRE